MTTWTNTSRVTRASELMARNPLSVNETTSICEAAAFLLGKRVSAAPVINEAGRPVGVVSLTDIVRHTAGGDSTPQLNLPVREIMSDEVLFVRPETPIDRVIDDLLSCEVKRLFVSDENGVFVGVVSTTDVLRFLNSEAAQPPPRRAYVPYRRIVPSLPARPAPFAATPQTGSDIIMAGARR